MTSYIDPLTGEAEEAISWDLERDGPDIENEEDMSALLGFDFENTQTPGRAGLRALIGSAFVPQKRLPALEVIFERASRLMTTTLRRMAGDTLDVHFDSISTARFGDFITDQDDKVVFAPVRSKGLSNYSLISVDTRFIFSTVDFLLGGQKNIDVSQDDVHDFTSIELALARRVLGAVCSDFSSAFSTLIPEPFELERVETNMRFAAISQPATICVIAKFRLVMGGNTGILRMVLPYSSIDGMYVQLSSEYIQENKDNQDRWRTALMRELSTANFDLSVVLGQRQSTVGELTQLKVGDVWVFDQKIDDPLTLKVGSNSVASANLGRDGDKYAVCLTSPIHKKSLNDEVSER